MNAPADKTVLAINGGSSSIKFALFQADDLKQRRVHGRIERIGSPGTRFEAHFAADGPPDRRKVPHGNFNDAIDYLIRWLDEHQILKDVHAAGHRVVHGMQRTAPARIDAALLKELRELIPYDPEHLPSEIGLMQRMLERCPDLPQVACFDTAFHSHMPRVAKLLAIPRRYDQAGIRRYGFHGLSYAYLLQRLSELGDPAARDGKVVLAHLGNGASLAAVRNGACVDTTMGFTPAAGVPMSTRAGDLDPGLLGFLGGHEHLSAARLQRMLTHESGLLGISETSSDLRDLLEAERHDVRAAEAVALFCQEVRKRIGAFATVLGGLDTLVFSAGIGEHAWQVRERVCTNLEFLGVQIDPTLNREHAAVISSHGSQVTVRVVPTDEESMIAQLARDYVNAPR